MKLKTTLLALAVSAVSVFGQGLVTFQNSTISSPIKLSDGTTLMPAGGGAFSFQFIYGTSAGTMNNSSAIFFNSDVTAGRISTNNTAGLSLAVPGGAPASFQFSAWSTSAGSYAESLTTFGAYHYQSGVITLTPATSPSPATTMFGVNVGSQFQGFNFVQTVPEPSTIALGVLGAGSLLFLRRKK